MKKFLACMLAALALAGCQSSHDTETADGTGTTQPADASAPRAPDTQSAEQRAQDTAAADQGTPAPGNSAATAESADDPLIAGLDDQNTVDQYLQAKEAVAGESPEITDQLLYVRAVMLVGLAHHQQAQQQQAYDAFLAAAQEARKLTEQEKEIPLEASSLLANVFYNGACALSKRKDVEGANAMLDDAAKWGFSNLDWLTLDEDLEAVRAQPDFEQRMAAWKESAAQAALASGTSFPFDFSLTDVNGQTINLADHKGKVVIVDVWGTWCPPCRAEIPSFVKLQETYGDQGFQMIGLNDLEQGEREQQVETIKAFMAENSMNYPCAIIDDATRSQIPDLQGYPTTLFIDRSGKVRLTLTGLHDYAYLELLVTTLLAEPAPSPAAGEGTAAEGAADSGDDS